MASYQTRRRADIDLWKGARAIKRDRSKPRAMRKAARRVAAAFWWRVKLRRHGPPTRANLVMSAGFRYGNYIGVGWGIVAGNVQDPIDELDALGMAHDMVYAPVEALEHWLDMRDLIEGRPC
jgi:hypothetical protein